MNGLIVAKLTRNASNFTAKIIDKTKINNKTTTFTLKMDKHVPGVSLFYSDLSMAGKHYLVRSLAHPSVLRHYTVSNSMKPDIYS